MLTGADKKTAEAKEILLDLAEHSASSLSSADQCYMYVYLGYIEDLAGNREDAIGWFTKGAVLEGPGIAGIRDVARAGLTRAVTWIKHLDPDTPPGAAPARTAPSVRDVVERIGGGLVLKDQPQGVSPAADLSMPERLENFDVLAEAIDRHFSFFVHKGIDWPPIVERYRAEVEETTTTNEFYALVWRFMRELNDFHSWLCNYDGAPALGRFSPGIITWRIEGRLVVTDVLKGSDAERVGLRRGSIITSVNGMSVDEKVQQMKPLMHVYSSERGFLERAYRDVLKGEEGSVVSVEFAASAGGAKRRASLKRTVRAREEIGAPGFAVDRGKFIWYGKHPSGCGYIRIVSFSGREEIADEFDYALERLKDTPGLIIDVRENPGGYGTPQRRIIGRLITSRTKGSVSFAKSGPGHEDFSTTDEYFEPTGDWQYDGPVALLTNAITGSACDLFVCRMISTGRPVTIGTATHGNLTGTCVFVQLPCGLVARISGGYISDASGRVIEGNGNVPDIPAEPTIADVVNGTDSVLERAVEEMKRRNAAAGAQR